MVINRTKLFELLMIFAFSVMSFGYLGIFSRYRYIPSIIIIVIILFFVIFRLYPIRRRFGGLWFLVLLFLIFSTLFYNLDTGYYYLLIFTAGFLVFILYKGTNFYMKLLNAFEFISILFAIGTIINSFYPNIVIDIFGFMLTQTQEVNILRNIAQGGYPGLAGEVSFNGFCLSIGFSIVLAKLMGGKKFNWLSFIKLLLLYYAVILTGKRSLIMILPFVLICVFSMIAYKGKGKVKKIFLLMLLLAIPLVYHLYLGDIVQRLLNDGGTTVNMSNRDWFWNIAFEMFNSKPIFGHGINTYDFFYNIYKTQPGYVYYAGAHNSYLQFFAELGVVGGVIYILSILLTLYITYKVFTKSLLFGRKNEQILITASITMQIICIIFAMSENTFYQPQQLFIYFIFAGMAVNLKRQQNVIRNEAVNNENINCKSV